MTIEQAMRYRTAAHEAAHCIAAYLVEIPLAKVEIDGDGHGLTKTKSPRRIIDGDPADSFNQALVLLAGGAYERSIGLEPTGDNGDFTKAAVLIAESFESKAAARQGFDIALEATHELVSSDRFHVLAARLTPFLADKSWVYGGDVEKFLRENDLERPSTERHSVGPRVSFVRHHRPPDHNPDCIVCREYPGWWKT